MNQSINQSTGVSDRKRFCAMHNDAATLRIFEEVSAVTLFHHLAAKRNSSLMAEFTCLNSSFTVAFYVHAACAFTDVLTC